MMNRHNKPKILGFYRDAETSDEETARSDSETAKSESKNVRSDDGNAELNDSINALVVSLQSQRKKRKAVTYKRRTGYKFCVTIRITA